MRPVVDHVRRRILGPALMAATAAELAPSGGLAAGAPPEAAPAWLPVRRVWTAFVQAICDVARI